MNTATVVEALLFHLHKGEPTPDQRFTAERISASYVAEFGPITEDTDTGDLVSRLQSLVMRDLLGSLR